MGVPGGIESGGDGADDSLSWDEKYNSKGPEWRAPGDGETLQKNPDGKRPVVGGNCWMVYCELSEQRKFWLCFNKDIITSDKTILLAESNSDPSIVESFLIDEKKTTLPLLISRVLQRLNGQKWIGVN